MTAEITGNTLFFDWEVALITWLQSHLGSFGVSLATLFTQFGDQFVIFGVIGFLYWSYEKEYGRTVCLNLLTVLVWTPLIKNIVYRRRPYFDHSGIVCHQAPDADGPVMDIRAQGYSFPSAHSATAAAVYPSLYLYKRKRFLLWACCILIFLVGLSRVCLGVHYPTDVLCGWALGFVIVFIISELSRRIRSRAVLYLILLLTGIPGWFYCTTSDFYSGYGIIAGSFAGFLFEDRFVRFGSTREPVRMILRLFGGAGVFLGLSAGIKLLIPAQVLASQSFLSNFLRALRYAAAAFVSIGIYPALFRFTAKIGTKHAAGGTR